MELQQLEYFRTVARHNHMTRAAKELYITQSSLSNSIHRLEQELGVDLFSRNGRRIQLNEYGRVFLEGVEEAFDRIEQSRERIRRMVREKEEQVRIVMPTSLQIYPEFTTSLIDLCPNIAFLNLPLTPESITSAFQNDEVDFIICADTGQPLKDPSFESVPLTTQELCIIVSRRHPLSSRGEVAIASLRDEPFACGGSQLRQLHHVCSKAGFTPRVLFQGEHLRDLLLAVSSGRYLFLSAWDSCLHSGLPTDLFVPLTITDYPCSLTRTLYWKKDEPSMNKVVIRNEIISFFEQKSC